MTWRDVEFAPNEGLLILRIWLSIGRGLQPRTTGAPTVLIYISLFKPSKTTKIIILEKFTEGTMTKVKRSKFSHQSPAKREIETQFQVLNNFFQKNGNGTHPL